MTEFYNDPLYVKMCEKAEDIQASYRNNDSGNFYGTKAGDIVAILGGVNEILENGERQKDYFYTCLTMVNWVEVKKAHEEGNKIIWLPRQDQLQRMIEGYYVIKKLRSDLGDYFKIEGLQRYKLTTGREVKTECESIADNLERALLEFVMNQLYNKTWNSEKEDWV